MAQVKAPPKNQLKKPAARAAAPSSSAPSEDVQAFSIAADSSVVQQLILLRVDPTDAQAAADAVSKALSQPEVKAASSGRAVLAPQGTGQPKRLVSLQLYSNKSLAVDLARGADGFFRLQARARRDRGRRRARLQPARSAPTSGAGARSVVADSVKTVKTSSATLASSLAPTGANPAALKELTQALAGFSTAAAKIDVVQGRTVDGTPRVLVAIWAMAPPSSRSGVRASQPARRLVRRSGPSPRRHGAGQPASGRPHVLSVRHPPLLRPQEQQCLPQRHRFRGQNREPIYAAADGVINHQGWYFNYGRTVKIGHADNFETLYAHMSRFADGVGPGTRVRKGDLIGYVGSTGRSTGPICTSP